MNNQVEQQPRKFHWGQSVLIDDGAGEAITVKIVRASGFTITGEPRYVCSDADGEVYTLVQSEVIGLPDEGQS